MSDIQKVKPTSVNGIEFYVALDGKSCGTSIRGAARLAGIPLTNLNWILTEVERLRLIQNDSSFNGKPICSVNVQKEALALYNDFKTDPKLDIATERSSHVLSSKFVSRLVRYYAYEAKKRNEIAKFSYGKFADIGVDVWIKEITCHSTSGDMTLVQQSLSQILDVLTTTNARLTSLEEQTKGYTKATIEMPGLEKWMNEYAALDESNQNLLDDGDLFTLSEYLWECKKIKFQKPAMSLFSQKVAAVYKTMSERSPKKKHGLSATGYKTPLTNAYKRSDFPLLDIAFKQTVLEI